MVYPVSHVPEERRFTPEVGHVVGKWTVTEIKHTHRGDIYTLECACGTIRKFSVGALRHSISFQCIICKNKDIRLPQKTRICRPFDDILLGHKRYECRWQSHRENGFCP